MIIITIILYALKLSSNCTETIAQYVAIDGNILRESSTERYRDKEMFRVARGNVDGTRQRVIGNCAGLLGPLPLIASYFTKSNGIPHSYVCVCLASLIYCLTKILVRTIDNRRNTIATNTEKDRLLRYLSSYLADHFRSSDVPFINYSRMPENHFGLSAQTVVATVVASY